MMRIYIQTLNDEVYVFTDFPSVAGWISNNQYKLFRVQIAYNDEPYSMPALNVDEAVLNMFAGG